MNKGLFVVVVDDDGVVVVVVVVVVSWWLGGGESAEEWLGGESEEEGEGKRTISEREKEEGSGGGGVGIWCGGCIIRSCGTGRKRSSSSSSLFLESMVSYESECVKKKKKVWERRGKWAVFLYFILELCYFDILKWTTTWQLTHNARSSRRNKKLEKLMNSINGSCLQLNGCQNIISLYFIY
jgi:hypothetical protein